MDCVTTLRRVADMAYINMAMQRRLREELHIGVLTRLPPITICRKVWNPP
jgi:hypothetical protein